MCKSFYLAPHKGLRYKLGMPRKPLSTKIDNDLQKEIKKLAIDMERSFNDLLGACRGINPKVLNSFTFNILFLLYIL